MISQRGSDASEETGIEYDMIASSWTNPVPLQSWRLHWGNIDTSNSIVHCRSGSPLFPVLWRRHIDHILAQCNWGLTSDLCRLAAAPFGSHWVKGVRRMIKTCSRLFGGSLSAGEFLGSSNGGVRPHQLFVLQPDHGCWLGVDLTQMRCSQRRVRCSLSTLARLSNESGFASKLELVESASESLV